MDWFVAAHDQSCAETPVLVHPSRELRTDAVARGGTRILTFAKPATLREAVRGFGKAVASLGAFEAEDFKIRLFAAGLGAGQFIERWTEEPRPTWLARAGG
jgi:hypothetical protein